MQYIDTLIGGNAITTKPEDVSNKVDFIRIGVDFHELKPIIDIYIPAEGAIVRNLKVGSTNVQEIVVTFTTTKGSVTSSIRGSPTALPTDQFPAEQVNKIEIEFLSTYDNQAPQAVTLSVIACAPAGTTIVAQGNSSVPRYRSFSATWITRTYSRLV
jgi:hypothetical protein